MKNFFRFMFLSAVAMLASCTAEDKDVFPVEPKVPVNSITLELTELELNAGDVYTFNAVVAPQNATIRQLDWKSSDTEVVTVNAIGKMVAVAAGEAIVSATALDHSGVTATCVVTVKQPVASITLDQTEVELITDETVTLTATIAPENATDNAVIWSSSDPTIATVSEDGVVTGVAPGKVTITATAADGSGVTATCTVTVNPVIED